MKDSFCERPLRRKKNDLGIGINNMLGMEHDCSVRDREKKFHTHTDDLVSWDQCEYELRLLETILMPTLDKIMSGTRRMSGDSCQQYSLDYRRIMQSQKLR